MMTLRSIARLRAPVALLALGLACNGGGPASPDDGGVVSPGELSIVWDGRTVDWGSSETLRAEINGQPVPAGNIISIRAGGATTGLTTSTGSTPPATATTGSTTPTPAPTPVPTPAQSPVNDIASLLEFLTH